MLNIFVDVSSVLDKNISALILYGDKMRFPSHPRYVEMVRSLAAFRGAQGGVLYAEALSFVRSVD
jgi:hypothetical protein